MVGSAIVARWTSSVSRNGGVLSTWSTAVAGDVWVAQYRKKYLDKP